MDGLTGGCKMRHLIAVLWPSFLTAGVATIVFFTLFDPLEFLNDSGVASPGDVRLEAYSIGFFLFWLLTALSCLLTTFFQRPPRS